MRIAVLVTVLALMSVACGSEADAPAAKAEPAATHLIVAPKVDADVPKVLAEHAALAKQANLTPFVELRADWCPPCRKLEAAMGDERIVKAFAGVYLIRLDTDAWGDALGGAGLDSSTIPVFYELDSQGITTGRKIDGGAWAEDIPENMAPVLDGFFHHRKS